MSGTRIASIELLSPDPLAAARFYREAFGCTQGGGPEDLMLGEQRLTLRRSGTAAGPAAPSNATAFQHCAIVVSDMGAAMERLASVTGWSPISRNGPERLPASSGGATAFKFRDPDGHPLELLQFPAADVPPRWRLRGPSPFLGIDHSAISVRDTDRAIAFWSGLGFDVTERHSNRGPEQARLDGFEGGDAEVEVTTLIPTGASTPHLELLCYALPRAVDAAAAEGSTLATALVLRDAPAVDGPASDPDGHRLKLLR